MAQRVGFYLDFYVPKWVGSEPVSTRPSEQEGSFNVLFGELMSDVWTRRISSELSLYATRGGLLFLTLSPQQEVKIIDLDFEEAVQRRGEQIKLCNAVAFCIHMALMSERQESSTIAVSHSDLIYMNEGAGNLGGSRGAVAKMLELTTKAGRADRVVDVLPVRVLDRAADYLHELIDSSEEKAVELANLLNRALAAYEDYDFGTALVAAWATIEATLSSMWRSYFIQESTRHQLSLNSTRRKKFEGADYTASIITDTLALAGLISEEERAHIERPRSARNKWIHNVQSPPREAVEEALATAHALLRRTLSVKWPQLGVQIEVRGF